MLLAVAVDQPRNRDGLHGLGSKQRDEDPSHGNPPSLRVEPSRELTGSRCWPYPLGYVVDRGRALSHHVFSGPAGALERIRGPIRHCSSRFLVGGLLRLLGEGISRSLYEAVSALSGLSGQLILTQWELRAGPGTRNSHQNPTRRGVAAALVL